MSKTSRKIVLGQTETKTTVASRMPRWLPWLGLGILACALAFWLGSRQQPAAPNASNQPDLLPEIGETSDPDLVQGGVFAVDTPVVELLSFLELDSEDINDLERELRRVGHQQALAGNRFNLRYLDLRHKKPESFTFEANDSTLVRLQFIPFTDVEVVERVVEVLEKEKAGIITSTYWAAILDNSDLHHSLIPLSEAALRWSVDLFHLQAGDRYKLLYREKTIGGVSVGVEELMAIQIRTKSGMHTVLSLPITADSSIYVDQDGYSLRRRFLRAPVKFGIISSPYNPRRLHPVDGVVRGHWGIDYAAPEGTPIYAMADGVVIRSNFMTANGNNVKIKHDETYTTGYLHLSDFAPGLSRGDRVSQGQVIGFVGQTGKATGPHVCFRFWENDDQVDFQQYENTGTPTFIPPDLGEFLNFRDGLMDRLNNLEIEGNFLK